MATGSLFQVGKPHPLWFFLRMMKVTLGIAIGSIGFMTACGVVRNTTALPNKGGEQASLAEIEAAIKDHGHSPMCQLNYACKFQYKDNVWTNFNKGFNGIALAVDVMNGDELPPQQLSALNAEATAEGEKIYASATNAASAQQAAEQAKQDAAEQAKRDAAEQAKQRAAAPAPANTSSSRQTSAQARCCINRQYYDCPSAAALEQCGGATSRCIVQCMSSSDMSCPDKCLQNHPPDPSGCTRMPQHDGKCPQ